MANTHTKTMRRLRDVLTRHVLSRELNGTEMCMLLLLAERGDTAIMDLEVPLRASKAYASKLALDLSDRKGGPGYVALIQNPEDHRSRLCRLTPKGRRIVAEICSPLEPTT